MPPGRCRFLQQHGTLRLPGPPNPKPHPRTLRFRPRRRLIVKPGRTAMSTRSSNTQKHQRRVRQRTHKRYRLVCHKLLLLTRYVGHKRGVSLIPSLSCKSPKIPHRTHCFSGPQHHRLQTTLRLPHSRHRQRHTPQRSVARYLSSLPNNIASQAAMSRFQGCHPTHPSPRKSWRWRCLISTPQQRSTSPKHRVDHADAQGNPNPFTEPGGFGAFSLQD